MHDPARRPRVIGMRDLATLLPGRAAVLDGGLGTLLEARGHDLTGQLWSARLLLEEPDAVLDAHREYFAAGADVAITGSYQVSADGMGDATAADRALRRSVELARRAADEAGGRIVAASVGPYGAALADGSEYRGDYGLTVAELRAWHRDRIRTLVDAGPDLLAAETIPCLAEVEAIAAEFEDAGAQGWISVTVNLRDLRSGESLREAGVIADASDAVAGVGINCSHPAEVLRGIRALREVTAKPIVVYPNSGEHWDARSRSWRGEPGFPDELVTAWRDAGASLVGGCCRVGPEEIRRIAGALGAEVTPTRS